MLSEDHSIAIIGMGAVFPESNGLKAYWSLIFNGKDAITEIPEESHWSLKDYFDENIETPDHIYCKRGGFIPKINFDPARYGFPPKNLEATDTSQLLGLMVAEMALEDAGYPAVPEADHSRTSVILGVTGTQELVIPLGARLYHPIWKRALHECGVTGEKHEEIIQRISDSFPKWQENSFPGLLGNVVAGRIANRLNLGGTNSVVDAACASSLSAIHTACLELASRRADLSVSGGVDTLNDIFMHMCFSKTGVLSHTSDARPFSKDADGTVLGEGIGMVVLKRLEDAKQDNDRIYAVIRGIGTSSDGKTGGIYAPDAGGQLRALKAAYGDAQIDPGTVELFEAHGTGTRVGDKIELTALKSLFACSGSEKNRTAVGSVKSMIGHAKAAAGAAGLIKAALSLHHKVIPPTLKAQAPDPEIDITSSRFYLPPLSKPWVKSEDHPRRSGVSAFGFGGSNFHLVLEEYSGTKEHVSWDGTLQIAAFSSDTKERLKEAIREFKERVNSCTGWDSQEKAGMLAWLTSVSREKFLSSDHYRVLMVITEDDDPGAKAEEVLKELDRGRAFDSVNASSSIQKRSEEKKISDGKKISEKNLGIFYGSGEKRGEIGFLFPGQGSQYTGMGRELISIFPEALESFELACKVFAESCQSGASEMNSKSDPDSTSEPVSDSKPISGSDSNSSLLKEYLFPPPLYAQDEKLSEAKLRSTEIAQPAIGAVSLAMAKILMEFGIRPHATCGHSFGELTALCAAGWIDEPTFFDLACARGRYMAEAAEQGGDPGTMFAVKASLDQIEKLIKSEGLDLTIANINSQSQVVVSGRSGEIRKAAKIFKKEKLRGVELTVAAAFHSHLVESAVEPFQKRVNGIEISCSETEVFSNTTGNRYPEDSKKIKELLGEQLINPVHFMSDIESMFESNITTFIEVGPKTVLTSLTSSILDGKDAIALAIDSSSGKRGAVEDLASLLCSLAASGVEILLERWESPVGKPAKKVMRIPLTGANVKPLLKPHPQKRVNQKSQSPDPVNISSISSYSPEPRGTDMKNRYIPQPSEAATKSCNAVKRDQNLPLFAEHHSNLIYSAMQMVQKGMESMQELQTRTALAHEKFLDTQSAASRTLQAMMEQTRFFAENAIYSQNHHFHQAPHHLEKSDSVEFNHTEPARIQESSINEPQVKVHEPAITARVDEKNQYSKNNGKKSAPLNISSSAAVTMQNRTQQDQQYHNRPNQSQPNQNQPDMLTTERLLLETVSTLTGFPVEMLNLDMDIESDLGIDSIKRVEIVSELEKQLPGADALTPDNMGTLRTLRDICKALAPASQPIRQQISTTYIPEHRATERKEVAESPSQMVQNLTAGTLTNEQSDHEESIDMSGEDVMTILMQTISELTGFPVEMLSPEMDLESDLGIDSIKRVEILSKLEEKLPKASLISPDDLGRLKTVAQIAQQISGDSLNSSCDRECLTDSEREPETEAATVSSQKKNC